MKFNYIFLLGMFILPFLTMAQTSSLPTFELEGKNIKNSKKLYIMHYSYADGEPIIDSAEVINGSFTLKKEFAGPAYAGVLAQHPMSNPSNNEFWFFLNPGKTIIDFSGAPKVVGGDKLTQTYMAYQEEIDKDIKSFKTPEYEEEMKKLDSLNAVVREYEAYLNDTYGSPLSVTSKTTIDFIKNNPDNGLSIILLDELAGPEPEVAVIEPLFKGLSEKVRSSYIGKRLASLLKGQSLVVGEKAIDFTLSNPEGKTVNLSDFRGKYVLIDFWASWCVPCRAENPNLIKAYDAYKSKNFEIIGVSLDNQKNDWVNAIEADKINWVQVSDLKGWNSAVAQEYGIRAIPDNVLIDPNGVIIAKNLRGDNLHTVLEKHIK
ncbi:redoxin domain-containing protein [Sphingobacterium lactis]|uniref:redoxin domain-containing protein n=1 Tax=Sphingobacterium lactis TaxID=797291 RepID=UPI003F809BF5